MISVGDKFFMFEKQYYGRGGPTARVPRRIERVNVEYEVMSEVMLSKINTHFVWVRANNGKNAGKESPFELQELKKRLPKHALSADKVPHGR